MVAGSHTIQLIPILATSLSSPFPPKRSSSPLFRVSSSSIASRTTVSEVTDDGSIASLNGTAIRGWRLNPSSVLRTSMSWQSEGRTVQSGLGSATRTSVIWDRSRTVHKSLGNGDVSIAPRSNRGYPPPCPTPYTFAPLRRAGIIRAPKIHAAHKGRPNKTPFEPSFPRSPLHTEAVSTESDIAIANPCCGGGDEGVWPRCGHADVSTQSRVLAPEALHGPVG